MNLGGFYGLTYVKFFKYGLGSMNFSNTLVVGFELLVELLVELLGHLLSLLDSSLVGQGT